MGRLEHDHYDLIIIDMKFPDVSGIEILRAIRKRGQLNDVPVFLMYDGEQPAPDEIQSAGKDLFIGKERGIDGIVDLISEEFSQ
jgi:CheY-like chemotaxis protein